MTQRELKVLQKEIKQLHEAQTTAWTVRFMVADIERTANGLIVSAAPDKRMQMLKCIRRKLKECQKALRHCKEYLPRNSSGGSGPDCPRGYHEEEGICVPDNPDIN